LVHIQNWPYQNYDKPKLGHTNFGYQNLGKKFGIALGCQFFGLKPNDCQRFGTAVVLAGPILEGIQEGPEFVILGFVLDPLPPEMDTKGRIWMSTQILGLKWGRSKDSAGVSLRGELR
jgi:hypothetical protein